MAAPFMTAVLKMNEVQEPPYCRLNFDITADIEDALVKGKRGLTILSDLSSFHEILLKEFRLIRTVIRIRQAQLRGEKEMQLLKRVKACLQRVHLMDRIFTIAADLLHDIKTSLRGELGHLPCKQSWVFLLYLISQYNRLLHQAVAYSLSAFQYLSCLMTVGQLLQVLVMFMGICARVWQACRTFSDKLASVYDQLYPVQQFLHASESDWVNPELPTPLAKDNNTSQSEHEKERGFDGSLSDPPIDLSRIKECASARFDVSDFVQNPSDSEEDIGVAVSIEECQKVMKRKAESNEIGSSYETKDGKSEENRVKTKKKKKKSLKAYDNVVLPCETQKETNASEVKVLKKKKKRKLKDITE